MIYFNFGSAESSPPLKHLPWLTQTYLPWPDVLSVHMCVSGTAAPLA
jgi:hypothetical protein